MKFKKEYIFLLVIILALSLYLVYQNPNRTQYELPQLPSIPEAEISKIEIQQDAQQVRLTKPSGQWQLTPQGYPADAKKIEAMLKVIQDLTLTALVSESQNFERYDLHPAKKITVKAWTGESVKREFDIGKSAPSFRHTFVTITGDKRIFHAQDNFRSTFENDAVALHDKTVLTLKADEIQQIQIMESDQALSLVKAQPPAAVDIKSSAQDAPDNPPAGPTWQSADGSAIDASKVDSLLSALSNLTCERYLYDTAAASLTEPVYTITLTGAEEYKISFFSPQDATSEQFPARSSQNELPFLLPDFRLKSIKLALDDYRAKEETADQP